MIKKFLPFYPALFFLTVFFSSSQAQQVQPFKTTPKSVIGYIEYLPPDYNSNTKNYPIVIFLHGLGQSGPSSNDPAVLETGYNSLIFYGPPRQVARGTNFPFILISPQLKNSYGNWPSWYVMEVIEYVKTYLRVDEKRIYLTGTSLGGGGAWVTAQDYPNYFAALAPVAGNTNSTSKACDIAASDLPVWAFHGDKDTTVPLSTSVNMVNAINKCGTNPPAKITIYPGLGHNAYSLAYDPTRAIQSPNLYDWMIAQVNDGGTLPHNNTPTADAGPDKTIIQPATSIILTGSGSDSDGTIIDYRWTQISGPTATLHNVSTTKLSAYNLVVGTYVFQLTVTDNLGAYKTDNVTLVLQAAGANVPPVVNAGADKIITLPVSSATLVGTASDADGTIASYSWTKVSGGNATLAGATTGALTASALVAGAYVFRLTVTDNLGAIQSDDVAVTVKAANIAPVVNAGADKIITLPVSSATLVGTASDADGTIASYSWTKISGGNATLAGATTGTLTASALVAGAYVFRLTVTDNLGAIQSDDVAVTVKAANIAPVVNAGADKIITLPTSSVTLAGTASDADGTIASYSWTKVSGGNATLAGATTRTLTASALVSGAYVFRLTATDNLGAAQFDDVAVTVNSSTTPLPNIPPVAKAGTDQTIKHPVNTIALTGSGTDADGNIASYSWMKVSGGAATLTGVSTPVLSATDLVVGTYVFRLTVVDDKQAPASDDVQVIVNPSSKELPKANAGGDKTVMLPVSTVVINGSGTAVNGAIVSYTWQQTGGTPVIMQNINSPNLTITGVTVASTKTFRLTVVDNDNFVGYDYVRVLYEDAALRVALLSDETVTPATETVLQETSASSDTGPVNFDNLNTCKDCTVIIYNETQQRIYEGTWETDTYQQVFSKEGLYVYHIMRNGKIVDRGKIFRH